MPASKSTFVALAFLFLAAISVFCGIDRVAGQWMLICYFCAFFGYFWLVTRHAGFSLFWIGLAARLMLFATLPTLSDDVFRFIWDGQLMLSGQDPYSATPQTLFELSKGTLYPQLFALLNSPNYFSVYPPLNQWLFAAITYLGGSSLLLTTNLLRTLLVGAEVGAFFLLRKWLKTSGKSPDLVYWYFLNPLAILEITGNVHLEGFVIFFLILGLFLLQIKKPFGAGFGIGMAIGTKLLPVIFLPSILLNAGFRNGIKIGLLALVIGLVPFYFFSFTSTFEGIGSSLSLYFQKFEFNASFYFLVREIGFWIKGYNIIGQAGPWLSLFNAACIAFIAIWGNWKKWPLPKTLLLTLAVYLLLSTTVHPWYILPLIPLGLMLGIYFPVVWSGVVFLTYLGYLPEGYDLHPVWLFVEYGIVFSWGAYELYQDAQKS